MSFLASPVPVLATRRRGANPLAIVQATQARTADTLGGIVNDQNVLKARADQIEAVLAQVSRSRRPTQSQLPQNPGR